MYNIIYKFIINDNTLTNLLILQSINTHEDTESDYLLNSVIVETVSMVVSRPTQTANIIQQDNNNLKNFKKFKKVTVKSCHNSQGKTPLVNLYYITYAIIA